MVPNKTVSYTIYARARLREELVPVPKLKVRRPGPTLWFLPSKPDCRIISAMSSRSIFLSLLPFSLLVFLQTPDRPASSLRSFEIVPLETVSETSSKVSIGDLKRPWTS